MGRPQLGIGTHGLIRYRSLNDGRIQARCLYRDHDGKTRPIARLGASKAAADRALQDAIRDRQNIRGHGHVHSNMRVTELANVWLGRVNAGDLAIGTKQQYDKAVNAYIRPRIGALRIREATVATCNDTIVAIAAEHGPAVAKTCRSVLSGMLGYAARNDALPANPVRDTERIAGASKPKKGKPRALSPAEADELCDGLRALPRANLLDIPDLVDFMLATGARIGEALACRDGYNEDAEQILDLTAGTWEVNATIIRVKGNGLHVQQRPKTAAGWRRLALPPYAVTMLRGRDDTLRLRAPERTVYSSPTRKTLRDPNNTAGDLKECLALLGEQWSWVTFHTFRKTVATRMREAGCSDVEVADQLGHANPSMTRNVYFGRQVTSARAAEVLER